MQQLGLGYFQVLQALFLKYNVFNVVQQWASIKIVAATAQLGHSVIAAAVQL